MPIKKVVDGLVHWAVHLDSLYAVTSILGLQGYLLIDLLATFLVDIDHVGRGWEELLDLNVAERFLFHNVVVIFLTFLGSLLPNPAFRAVSLAVLAHLTWGLYRRSTAWFILQALDMKCVERRILNFSELTE